MTAAWPRADARLERAYRRLLLAYPGRYRRHHGTEMITTLLEMAGPGQERPHRADVWHLLGSGLRHRFRLPAGRPLAWLAAVLITLIGGASGAAAGSWAGAQTFADLPDRAGVLRLAAGQLPTEHHASAYTRSPWIAETFFADGRTGTAAWDPAQAVQRFTAAGWTVGPVSPATGISASSFDPATGATVELPVTGATFRAESDGVQLTVTGYTAGQDTTVSTQGWAEATPAYLPLVLAGTLLGLTGGWLLAAAGTYRIARARRPRPAAALTTVAILTLVLPAVALYGNVMRALRSAGDYGPAFTVHSAFTPGPYYPFGPQWLILALTLAGVLLAAAAVLLARPTTQPALAEAPTAT